MDTKLECSIERPGPIGFEVACAINAGNRTEDCQSQIQVSESIHNLNIVFLIDRLAEMGGAELALSRLVRELTLTGAKPIVITFSDDICVDLYEKFSCPIMIFPLQRTYDLRAMKVAWKIRSFLVRKNIHLVHTFFETSDLFGGLITRSVSGVALVTSRRDMGILRRRIHHAAYPFLGKLAHRVVTVSERVREWCIDADRLAPSRVVTVYNGVTAKEPCWGQADSISRSNLREKFGLPQEAIVIIAVGHIRHVKGYDVLVKAAAILLQTAPDAVFVIAGAEHEKGVVHELQSLLNEKGIRRSMHFLGSVLEVQSLLLCSDIFVLPSRSEGFSNALVEAMNAGLPCVATDVGGNAEALLDGVSGFLVPAEDPQALSIALLHLYSSSKLRTSMGVRARRIVKNRFSNAATTSSMFAVYESALRSVRHSKKVRAENAIAS